MDYSKTVNLLQTAFPMKADLPTREPVMLEKWEKDGLYQRLQEKGRAKPVFLLHDGPPYANGVIHIGHALNKILKDVVVKYRTAAGHRVPYKPGWDCHGLPIEHQLFKQLGKSKSQVSRIELRQKAKEYAMSFVEKQRDDFKRLGVLGDWENPYLTLSNDYEASIVETFYALNDKGCVYKGLKPGYWCVYDETALAEAEVEYAEKTSDSVFVRFEVNSRRSFETPSGPQDDKLPVILNEVKDLFILIWTTTPWTLPANRGLAFHPDERYTTIEKNGAHYIVAEKLAEAVAKKIDGRREEGISFLGKEAVGVTATNPLTGLVSRAVTADYVTMEDGTGVVHIAPGHGVEDFQVGQKWNLEVASPVDERGLYDAGVGRAELVGKHVLKDANKAVMELLGENLVFHQTFRHSYPHCWRCKNPIVFRATEQWFLRVDDAFRKKLLSEIDRVAWEPAYGVHRIKGMVEQRPDWCLSRQRHWGAPIAVFYCANKECREVLWDAGVNSKIVELIRTQGADAYYTQSEAELTTVNGKAAACKKCGGHDFRKEMDILDVWFDSGVSWFAVVEKHLSDPKPEKVMYLEGSDQHRGWFQTSLIPSVALKNRAPYDLVLTHGFVVDGKGHKMSKSLGNVVVPQEIIKQYGADVLRLWVAMSDYREDVRISQDIVKHMVDVYRRFRNTFRFLLQNTADFRRADHAVAFEKLEEIDRWVLVFFDGVKARVLRAYEQNEFHVVLSELNQFVAVTLSGFYLDAQKDRLYCEAPGSPLRRSAQTALYHLARGLSLLLAPLLSFTSEEAHLELRATSDPALPDSVFLDAFSALPTVPDDQALLEKWAAVLEVRSRVNDELDRQRKAGVLKSSQEAAVTMNAAGIPVILSEAKDLRPLATGDPSATPQDDNGFWPFVLQMAEVRINAGLAAAGGVAITATAFKKCERCWRHRADVGTVAAHPTLCRRCADALPSAVAS